MSRAGGWPHRTMVRGWRIGSFVAYMVWDFVQSNLQVLAEVVRPRLHSTPAVVEVRLASRTDREVVSLANLLTLTPGTLTLEVFHDPPTLFVHGMFVRDPEEFRQQVLALERRMLAALRPVTDGPGPDSPVGTEVVR